MTNKNPDFEQFVTYGDLPDTGMELNLREMYDLTAKAIRDHDARHAAAGELATLVRRKTESLGVLPKQHDTENVKHANDLTREGFVRIPDVLTQDQIKDIENYIADVPITDFYNPDLTFQLKDTPPSTNIGRYGTEFNVNCPHIFKAINHPDVLSIVEQFLGAPPTLSVLMLMWSFVNDDPAKFMQLYHRDSDDYRFCKLFVYLSDVDDDLDGPHIYISRSGEQRDVSERLDALNLTEGEKATHLKTIFAGFPNHRYDDALIHKIFAPDQRIRHLGGKGTSIIENTWGIHRGLPPKRKPRLLLQAQFTLQASPMFTYEPRDIISADGVGEGFYEKYVNRLYIK